MANASVPSDAGWIQVTREAPTRFEPTVRLRQQGDLSLSATFVRHADIAARTRVNLFVSADGFRLGMRFHDDETQSESFQIGKDGGGKSRPTNSRVIPAGAALRKKSATIQALLRQPESLRTFKPKKDVHGVWTLALTPCFETEYRLKGQIQPSDTGIYRYSLGGEAVYIGRGLLVDRIGAQERREWQFDSIHYSIINNEDEEKRLEALWLDHFRSRHNRWPVYNRIGGAKRAQSEPEQSFG